MPLPPSQIGRVCSSFRHVLSLIGISDGNYEGWAASETPLLPLIFASSAEQKTTHTQTEPATRSGYAQTEPPAPAPGEAPACGLRPDVALESPACGLGSSSPSAPPPPPPPPPADDGSPVVVPPAKAANPPVLKASVSVGVGTDAKAEVSVGVAPRTADVAVTADVGTSSTPPPPDEPAAGEGAEAAEAVEAPAAEAAEPAAAEAAEAPAAEDAAAAPDDPGEGQ